MTIAPRQPKPHTAEEYLALEVESEIRHEYRNGEIIPMTGGTPEHNEITGNLIYLLKSVLRGQPYSIFVTDQRLWIPDLDLYTYPDVMVIQRPLELKPGRKDTVTNPVLIAEVLSDSTQGYDRGEKFAAYRTIPTFQEYLLIDQSKAHVEQFVWQSEHQWLFTEYKGLEAQIGLSSVPVEIGLKDLYEGVIGKME
ncbi:Uma2 family endonuclease [Egbenema bharatensis]|uniref:Uma2 family endonuclease n=1 Tax=Egbenema bharatensis TaxID=3463334 RepID=UPI003A8901DA